MSIEECLINGVYPMYIHTHEMPTLSNLNRENSDSSVDVGYPPGG